MASPVSLRTQEVRLALVLNGGVSLAIWMGGVVGELDRARRARGAEIVALDPVAELYGELLELADARVVIDVVTGASAGGLNGVLLAQSVANGRPVDRVREVWLGLGSFRRLLRSGLEPAPPSLLRGDDYFLQEMKPVFADGATPATRADGAAVVGEAITVMVTGTDLAGEPVEHRDDYEAVVRDREHRALFVLRHAPPDRTERAPTSDFRGVEAAFRLARIARTTASFPAAFEPSFGRVHGDVPAGGRADDHPDLAGVATFSSSRWLIDGGVLDNQPFAPALAAIARAGSERPVRRVLAFVVPYATDPDATAAARLDEQPGLKDVLGAVSNLPRDLTVTTSLEDLEDYRRRVRHRRAARRGILGMVPAARAGAVDALWRTYVAQRARVSVQAVLDALLVPGPAAEALAAGRSVTRPQPHLARVLDALGRDDVELPWLPPRGAPPADPLEAFGGDAWRLGSDPVVRAAAYATDLLSRALDVAVAIPDAALADVADARDALSAAGALARNEEERVLRAAEASLGALARTTPPALDAVAADVLRIRATTEAWRARDAGGEVAAALASAFQGTAFALALGAAALLPHLAPVAGEPAAAAERRAAVAAEVAVFAQRDEAAVRRLLLELEVVHEAIAPAGDEPDQRIEFIRINAEAECALSPLRDRPEAKLAGLQLMHFGAFYKESWRANDWMWGRLDGAARVVDVLLEPERLRARVRGGALSREALAARLGALAGVDAALAAAEVAALVDGTAERLPVLRQGLLARAQTAIAREELPVVHAAIGRDVVDGAAPDGAGPEWAARVEPATWGDDAALLSAFRSLRIAGAETLGGELGADLLTRNAATSVAVGVSMLAAPRSHLPRFARAVPLLLRGIVHVLYALAWGLTSRRHSAKVAVLLALVISAAIIAWGIGSGAPDPVGGAGGAGGGGPPGFLLTAAKAVVVAGFLLAVLRAPVAAAGAAAAFVALALLLWLDRGGDLAGAIEANRAALYLLGIVVLGTLAGTVRGLLAPLVAPLGLAGAAATLTVLILLPAALALAGLLVWLAIGDPPVRPQRVLAVLATYAAVAGLVALIAGWRRIVVRDAVRERLARDGVVHLAVGERLAESPAALAALRGILPGGVRVEPEPRGPASIGLDVGSLGRWRRLRAAERALGPVGRTAIALYALRRLRLALGV